MKTKTEKLGGGYTRETKTYNDGSTKSVVSKPQWGGFTREIKSVTKTDPKRK